MVPYIVRASAIATIPFVTQVEIITLGIGWLEILFGFVRGDWKYLGGHRKFLTEYSLVPNAFSDWGSLQFLMWISGCRTYFLIHL